MEIRWELLFCCRARISMIHERVLTYNLGRRWCVKIGGVKIEHKSRRFYFHQKCFCCLIVAFVVECRVKVSRVNIFQLNFLPQNIRLSLIKCMFLLLVLKDNEVNLFAVIVCANESLMCREAFYKVLSQFDSVCIFDNLIFVDHCLASFLKSTKKLSRKQKIISLF